MRALCGAIITAGALIGLGITALAIGTRYQYFSDRTDGKLDFLGFKALDTPLMVIVVFLMIAAVVGFGLAVVGLALHHERRRHELHGHSTAADRLGPTGTHLPVREPVA
jgi:hypothetical protein